MTQMKRKPRLLVAGEFSAGKTQLINGLLGANVLPSNVTATALPPVWISADHMGDRRVGLDGTSEPLRDLRNVALEGTLCCEMQMQAPILDYVDLIDTPGNSDPNIDATSWMRMLDCADMVIWCSNAVQAWRQSEKAVWQAMPPRLRRNATLVVTHADRLHDSQSADRLMRRVLRETDPFFDHHILASLLVETDLDFVANHVVTLAGQVACTGADLLSAAPQQMRPSQQGPNPTPRRVARPIRVGSSPAAEPTAQNVVPLFDGASAKSRAEAIWAELVKNAPPNSPEEWQAMMAEFMRAVDGELEPAAATPARHLGAK
ncbi:50S ribosome-binding GTPase [Rhodobacteraceae bacterium XHP0102]|nr:50S ribosome-binding GTPase [Rhodobacteraceae bacterium XHP0102]